MICSYQERIQSRFQEFRSKDLFLDCIIRSIDTEIKCHRVVIAKYSTYFKNIILCLPNQEKVINVDFDPLGLLSDVIDFFYSNKISITKQNYPLLAGIAKYYEVDSLMALLEKSFNDMVQNSDLLTMLEQFILYKVNNLRDLLIPIIAKNFNEYDHAELCRCADTYSYTQILQVQEMNEWDKIEKIEEFVATKGLDNVDGELLSYLIQWEESAFEYFLFYPLDWVPARIQRKYISSIITNRRITLKSFSFIAARVKDTTNRWFVISWIKQIADSDGSHATKSIELISFIQTLGGIVYDANAHKYGFIETSSSPAIGSLFTAKEAIQKSKRYFMSISQDTPPYMTVSFDSSLIFVPSRIVLDFGKQRSNKPLPKGIEIEFSHLKYPDLEFQGKKLELQIQGRTPPLQKLFVRMKSENEYGGNALRIANIKLYGTIKESLSY